jgi:hypothetical protein
MSNHIQTFLHHATNCGNEEVALHITALEGDRYRAAIVSASNHEDVVTMESDWTINMEATHATIVGALACLDVLCFEDLSYSGALE